MENTIDMQGMRYLNLFDKVTQISTRYCFKYNDGIIFCVPKNDISKAVGRDGKNVRRLGEILRKRVKIIAFPRGTQDAKIFIEAIVSPVQFKDVQITGDEIVINSGGTQNKAALIGRNKRRMEEMQAIVKNYFKRNLRIL